MSKVDLEKPLLTAGALVLFVLGLLVVRGGGYGIGGLTWDTHLYITQADPGLRIGSFSVELEDRIVTVNAQRVYRDADLRGVLRAASDDAVWIEIERRHYQVAIPLTPEMITNDDLPAILRGPYEVVAIDDRRIYGDMNLNTMASWMEQHGGMPSVFTVSVPNYTYEGEALRVKRPGPLLAVIVLVFTLALTAFAWLRGRSSVMGRRRHAWHLLGLSLASGGLLLAFLSAHDRFLADPWLLPWGLVALALWRPVGIYAHQAQRGDLLTPTARFFRLGVGLPAAILLLTSLYGWSRTLPELSGQPRDGFVFDQLRLLILVAAGILALYHLADLAIQANALRRNPRRDSGESSTLWIGQLIASLFIVSAMVSLSADATAFLEGGFVPHLAGLVSVQMLADLALLYQRQDRLVVRPREAAGLALTDYLADASERLGLRAPHFVCQRDGAAVALRLVWKEPDETAPTEAGSGPKEAATPEEEPWPAIEPAAVEERLVGLLDLLEAEGGMFPRYKTIRGGDEAGEDPFDGMGAAVGVELVLPLPSPDPEPSSRHPLKAYLVSRAPVGEEWSPALLDADALAVWGQSFHANPDVWTELRIATAEALVDLELAKRAQAAPVDEDAVAVAQEEAARSGEDAESSQLGQGAPMASPPSPNGPPAVADDSPPAAGAVGTSGADGGGASTDEADRVRLRLAYLEDREAFDYPVDEPDLVDESLVSSLQTFVASRGAMLIWGELGSGREFTARLIHRLALPRGPFVGLDCARVPAALLLPELLGDREAPGYLSLAEGGTLCLRGLGHHDDDTVGRVVEALRSSEARPILIETVGPESPGQDEGRGAEAVVAREAVRRLVDEAILRVAPLRERASDLRRAAHFYLHREAMALGRLLLGFSEEALSWLCGQPWRSNFHGLKAVIREVAVAAPGERVELGDLQAERPVVAEVMPADPEAPEDLAEAIRRVERRAFETALERSGGNKSAAARLLGMKRTTFIRKLNKYTADAER